MVAVPYKNLEQRAKYLREYRQKNKERINESRRAWEAANPEKRAEQQRRYWANNQGELLSRAAVRRMRPEERAYQQEYRNTHRVRQRELNRIATLRQYGLTPESFEELLRGQGGRCAICRSAEPTSWGWHVDHCHATDRVRGVLCHRCNVGLGHFKDDPVRLRAAVEYVERHLKAPTSGAEELQKP